MTASVPFCAPVGPPLTGASTATMPFDGKRLRPLRSPPAARWSTDRRNVLTREPAMTPSLAERDCAHHSRRRQADQHGLGGRSHFRGRPAALRPAPKQRRHGRFAGVVDRQLEPASSSRLAMGPPIVPTPTKPSGKSIILMTPDSVARRHDASERVLREGPEDGLLTGHQPRMYRSSCRSNAVLRSERQLTTCGPVRHRRIPRPSRHRSPRTAPRSDGRPHGPAHAP